MREWPFALPATAPGEIGYERDHTTLERVDCGATTSTQETASCRCESYVGSSVYETFRSADLKVSSLTLSLARREHEHGSYTPLHIRSYSIEITFM